MTTILTAPEAIIHLVKCKCVKERCTTKRCQCSKANMNCMDLCGFSDMGELAGKFPKMTTRKKMTVMTMTKMLMKLSMNT